MRANDNLVVDFIGLRHELTPGEELTFGRSAGLEIDDNPHLHRLLGRFSFRNGSWWLRNEGRSIPILLADKRSRSKSTISPGREMPIGFRDAFVRFRAGACAYQLELTCAVQLIADQTVTVPGPEPESDTISLRSVPLTDDQRLVLVALAEPSLRDPHAPIVVLSNAEMAHRLGWTLRRFNRKVDNLCEKFTKAGVNGLHGSVDRLASDRRRALVEHCVDSGVVTSVDLASLDSIASGH